VRWDTLPVLKYHHGIALLLLQERRLAEVIVGQVLRLLASTSLASKLLPLLLGPPLLRNGYGVVLIVLSVALRLLP